MVGGLLVFARCLGFVFRAPGFSHPSVPVSLRAGFAATLALTLAPTAARVVLASTGGEAFVLAVVVEFLIGSVIGMTASLIYDAAYAGGRAVDDYVGVKAIAPSLQLVAPSGFGRVWSLVFTGAFFVSGAYRLTLLGFADGFARLPPGSGLGARGWIGYAAAFASTFLVVALEVAAPAIALAFVVQVALGAVSRAVPRFGSFTLAFPLAFAAALVATAMLVPNAVDNVRAPILAIPSAIK